MRPFPKSLTTTPPGTAPMPLRKVAPGKASEPSSAPLSSSYARITLFPMATNIPSTTSMPCEAWALPK